MIKVNLLRDQTARVRKSFARPTVSRMGLIFAAIFVLASAGMATWYFRVSRQIKSGTERQNQLRVEDARLQSLKKQIDEYDRLKKIRQAKIDVIEKLKNNQTGPVLLLNTVIESIPRDGALWLTNLTQQGNTVKIVGYTQHTEYIPDFMTNLATSKTFKTVDLEQLERQEEATRFSLSCTSGMQP